MHSKNISTLPHKIVENGILYFVSGLDLSLTFIGGILPKIEFYGVLFGLKEIGYIGLGLPDDESKNRDILISIFNKYGFSSKEVDYGSYKVLIYAKNMNSLTYDVSDLGKMLGYPECCIFPGKSKKIGVYNGDHFFNKYSCTHYKFPYQNNIIFTTNNRQYRFQINNEVFSFSATFISHTPCSLGCEESFILGKKMEKLLEKFDTTSLSVFQEKTKKNYIYFDSGNWCAIKNSLVESSHINIFEGIFTSESLRELFSSVFIVSFDLHNLLFTDNDGKLLGNYINGKDFIYLEFI